MPQKAEQAKKTDAIIVFLLHGAKYLNALGIIVALWAFFIPLPYRLVITLCALIFLSAIFAFVYSKGAIRLETSKKSKVVNVAFAIAGSSIALAWRAFGDFHFVNSRDLLAPVGIVFFCSSVCLYLKARDLRLRAPAFLIAFPYLFAFSFGAVTEVNGLFPSEGPAKYRAKIISKQVNSGGDGPSLYYLMVTRWGDRDKDNKLIVSKRVYNSFNVNDDVAIMVWQGSLNIPYYYVLKKRSFGVKY